MFLDTCQWLHTFPPLPLVKHSPAFVTDCTLSALCQWSTYTFPPSSLLLHIFSPLSLVTTFLLVTYKTFCDYRKIHIAHTRMKDTITIHSRNLNCYVMVVTIFWAYDFMHKEGCRKCLPRLVFLELASHGHQKIEIEIPGKTQVKTIDARQERFHQQ